MASHIRLKSFTLRSGRELDISQGMTAIVGPNNAGKSLLLREIHEQILLDEGHPQLAAHKVVSSVAISYPTTAEALVAHMKTNLPIRAPGIYNDGQWGEETMILANGSVMPVSHLPSLWGRSGSLGQAFGAYFAIYLNAESRLGLAADTPSFDPLTQAPANPLQRMTSRPALEKSVNEAVRDAFGQGITVNRLPGSMIHLHAGETVLTAKSLTPSDEYIRELQALPLMQAQGDGMRAFVGMVMSVITGQFPLLLIDEPEAFLHPPQARRFGQFLMQQRAIGTQIILATHSEDIIAGLTSTGDQGEISLMRITRHESENFIAQLEPTKVQDLFKDPLIRYFNMTNGLFANGVVLCEADGDCTYFRAAVEHAGAKRLPILTDAHFTHAAGKSRVPKALAAFRAIAVPTVAIFDIDILRDDTEFHALARAIGEDPAIFQAWRNTINNEVSGSKATIGRSALEGTLSNIFVSSGSRNMSQGDLRKIRDAATPAGGWADLKKAGTSLLTSGAVNAYNSITQILESKGVFVLEQGELERLHSEVPGGDKSKWLRAVIDRKLYKKSPALAMLGRLERFLNEAQSAALS